MPFNSTTAYLADWRYTEGVEDGVLTKRRANATEIESYPVKLLREARRAASVKYLWLTLHTADPAPPAPAVDDAIELVTLDYDGLTPQLVITDVVPHATGPYEISCVEPPRNA